MKSKKLMLSMVAILISFFALVGCEKKPPTPTPTPEPIPPVVATKESFTKYFNDNIFVEYNTSHLPDQNGDIFSVEKNTYKMLVDRQITLLADNVLYRLFSIYGPGASNNFVLTDILNNNQPFVLKNATGEYNAEINQEDILLKAGNTLTDRYCFFDIPSDLPQSSVAHKEFVKDRLTTNPSSVVYLNEPAFYASMFYINNGIYDSSNKDLLMSHFKFTHAINGEFAWSDETGDFTSDFTQYAWNWSYGEKANDINNAPTFEKGYKIYRAMYLPELKLAIANIFATGNFTSTTTYDILRQSITNINLNKTMTFEVDVLDNSGKTVKQTRNQTRLELIKEFILTQIIGSNNAYAFDNDVYSDFAQHAGRDNFAILDSLTINTLPDTTHLYKAYDVIVPYMLNTISNFKFADNKTNIFLDYGSSIDIEREVKYNSSIQEKYDVVVIRSISNIDITKLVLSLTKSKPSSTYYVKYKIYSVYNQSNPENNTLQYTSKNHVLSANTNEIDLTESGVAKLPSSGAIVFEFSENNSAVQNSFGIKFDGYYNKVD